MSPYENRLNAESFRRIALISRIEPSQKAKALDLLSNRPTDFEAQLRRSGIHTLNIYQKDVGDRFLLFLYFESESLDQEAAIGLLKQSHPYWAELETTLISHPRATNINAPWQRAEFINVIADQAGFDRQRGQSLGLVAGLKVDSELWYRTLHQTNWPGVIDQMRRSHYQNWTTFMLEFDKELFLFTHVEYLGNDVAADKQLMADDPVTQRWWTHTQPCLYPLVPDEDVWAKMISL